MGVFLYQAVNGKRTIVTARQVDEAWIETVGSGWARLMRCGFASTHPTGSLVRWFFGFLVARAFGAG